MLTPRGIYTSMCEGGGANLYKLKYKKMSQIKGIEMNFVICDIFKFKKQILIKDYKLKCVISILVKKENNNGEKPQYEINLPALLISFSRYA